MLHRRTFLKHTTFAAAALPLTGLSACTETNKSTSVMNQQEKIPSLKISLAQWSLHREIESGVLDPVDFARVAKERFQIEAVEYVNGFYQKDPTNEKFWLEMLRKSQEVGVKNLLIMVDEEGDLGQSNANKRQKAVENHYKWVNAAKILDCHSIRVNAFGDGERAALHDALVDGIGQLCDYAAKENIDVLIENHGLLSSDASFIINVIQAANRPNLGTLPDFGNWCLAKKWGSTQHNRCEEVYDRYRGVAEFLPYAKGYSAKSYAFDENGNETIIDYRKMLQMAKDGGYDGYIGIEFEGENMEETTGIKATKALIERVWKEIYK